MENIMYFFRILADIGKAFRRVNETILKLFKDILMMQFSLQININPKADHTLGCNLRRNKRFSLSFYLELTILPRHLNSHIKQTFLWVMHWGYFWIRANLFFGKNQSPFILDYCSNNPIYVWRPWRIVSVDEKKDGKERAGNYNIKPGPLWHYDA